MPSVFSLRTQGDSRAADLAEVRRALAVLVDPTEGFQLQVKPFNASSWATFAGTDLDGACHWVGLQTFALGMYWHLNPVPKGLANSAKVDDILRRRWLMVDVDRCKDLQPDDPATDDEHERAGRLAGKVTDLLSARGWPAPVLVDSGNGYQLLYRILLANDGPARILLKRVLERLDAGFPADGLGSIGVECHDARRLARLPGTWTKRGVQSKQRPYRLAKLLHVPQEVEVVTQEQLEALAGVEEAKRTQPAPKTVLVVQATNGDGSQLYLQRAIEKATGQLVLAPVGKRNDTLNKEAYSLGGLVSAGAFTREAVEESLTAAALACGLDEREIASTLRSGLNSGIAAPRVIPERNGSHTNGTRKQAENKEDTATTWRIVIDGEEVAVGQPKELVGTGPAPAPTHQVFEMLSASRLMATVYPEPRWVVPGLLSEGLNLLAGKPKQGKSMMALNLGLTVAGGGTALGATKVKAGDVLYLSLEDRHRRLQSRIRKMMTGIDCQVTDRLKIVTQWPRQDRGGLQLMEHWVDNVEHPKLVIIDVWAKFRPNVDAKGSLYDQDYAQLGAVQEFLNRHECSSLVLHHTRKGGSEDAIEEISGSHGLSGVADGLLVLIRARNSNEAKVVVTGRDVGDAELALEFVSESLTWKNHGDAKTHGMGQVKAAILDAFQKAGKDSSFWPNEMATLLNKDGDTIRKEMWRMAEDGILQKKNNKYVWPPSKPVGVEEF